MAQKCDNTLHYKIENYSGRLAHIMERLSGMVHELSLLPDHEYRNFDSEMEALLFDCFEYGPEWMKEVSGNLKQLYNRTQGA